MDEHLLTQQQMEAIQKNGFKTEMFGFHRAQVLSYLESLSQQYVQQEAELRAHAEELQAQLMSVQNMLRESAARENALTVSRDEQARRVHMAQAETQAFRAELISTREEINSLHAKLEEAEKKLAALQKERDELLTSNDSIAGPAAAGERFPCTAACSCRSGEPPRQGRNGVCPDPCGRAGPKS